MAERQITTLADPEALAQHTASWLAERARTHENRFVVCLSGGSTPKRLFEILAAEPYGNAFPWARTHLWWGDERFVPYTDKDSNYGMTRHALLDHVTIPPENIHPMPTAGSPHDAARAYQSEMQNFYDRQLFDPGRPFFDVIFLGLGENGHTASLFPGTPSLDETLAWVVPVVDNVPQPRLTLTYPAIASSRDVAFLVAGEGKRTVLRRVLDGDRSQPAARVSSIGTVHWFTDKAALP